MIYLLLKTVHILAAVLFIGNITTGILWKLHGDRSNDPRVMAHTLAGIIRADRWFTMPAVIVLLLSGLGLAHVGGYPFFGTFWIWAGLALFVATGIVAGRWVAPVQRKLLAVAGAPQFDAQEYARLSAAWARSGSIATLLPLAALVLMVFKPVF
ncbi:MAG TPA: DUF2269 family protein [Gammaproteobacteria bacterium]